MPRPPLHITRSGRLFRDNVAVGVMSASQPSVLCLYMSSPFNLSQHQDFFGGQFFLSVHKMLGIKLACSSTPVRLVSLESDWVGSVLSPRLSLYTLSSKKRQFFVAQLFHSPTLCICG